MDRQMNTTSRPTARPSSRRAAGLALALAAGTAASTAHGAIVDWTGTAGSQWGTGTNWTSGATPAPADIARIGAHAAAENAFLYLNMDDYVAELQITDGMILQTDGHKLVVSGRTSLTGENLLPNNVVYSSRIDVEPAAGIALQTGELVLSLGAALWMKGGELVVVNDFKIGVDCSLYGWGDIRVVQSDAEMVNDGIIQIRPDTDTTIDHAGGLVDLDGFTGDGWIYMNQYEDGFGQGAQLTITAQGLADTFSSRIQFGGGSGLTMNLQQPWELDSSSEVVFFDAYDHPGAVTWISGAGLTMSGHVRNYNDGSSVVASETIDVEPTATFDLRSDSNLLLGFDLGPGTPTVDVHGGVFTFEEGAELHFGAETTVEDAQFDMVDATGAGGRVEFDRATTYVGGFTTNGYARQNADARVALPSTFNAGTFDIDGDDNDTAWDVEYTTTFNIGHTGAGYYPTFSGTFDIAAGIQPRVTMNVDADRWISYGDIVLRGYTLSHLTRLGGSPLSNYGAITLTSSKAAIDAEITFASPSTVDLQNANADLRLNQDASVAAGATFTGLGTLRVGPSSLTSLSDGASVGVRVANDGALGIGSPTLPGVSFGMATVADFVQSAGGTLAVSVGGYGVGAEYDRLTATGAASQAGGTVSPIFKKADGKSFVPGPGDTFEFFTAPQGYTGSFADTSPTFVPVNSGLIKSAKIDWVVDHSATTAEIRVADVTFYCYADVTTSHTNPGDEGYGVPDSVVDGADLAYFVEFWLAGDAAVADINTKNVNPGDPAYGTPDGLVDGADLSFYVERWLNGCQ